MQKKISLPAAILVNVNIMLGSGIFLNTILLAKNAGALGAAVYGLVGILILPLIAAFSGMLTYYPQGTLYEFGQSLHPAAGFVSSWGYFIGKLASAAIGIHVFVTLMQQIFPTLGFFEPLLLDLLIIILFTYLNFFNLRIGSTIQFVFITLKFIPITFAILVTLFFLTGAQFDPSQIKWDGVARCMPFVLFVFAGFEAICSISRSISDAPKNGPRAILFSYLIVLTTVIAYQLGFFAALGYRLGELEGVKFIFKALTEQAFPGTPTFGAWCNAIALIGIASSALGASYGILYTNAWNLYTLGNNGAFGSVPALIRLNSNGIPFACVLIEAVLTFTYLYLGRGNHVPLQQVSALGSTIAYTITALAFASNAFHRSDNNRFIALLSLASCSVLLAATINSACFFGCMPYILYIMVLVIGLSVFIAWRKK